MIIVMIKKVFQYHIKNVTFDMTYVTWHFIIAADEMERERYARHNSIGDLLLEVCQRDRFQTTYVKSMASKIQKEMIDERSGFYDPNDSIWAINMSEDW